MRTRLFRAIPLLMVAVLAPACGSGGSDSPAAATPPQVFSVGPADLSAEVSPTLPVSVTFTKAMNQAATEGAFSLTDGVTPVTGTFAWSGFTMTFTPGTALATGTAYTVGVTTASVDTGGLALTSSLTSTFTTGSAPVAAPTLQNRAIDLALEPEPPTEWTASGAGTRAGITVTTIANQRVYTRSDFDISNRQAFVIEAIVSAPAVGSAGERGARIWARFSDPDAPAFPPGAKSRFVEVRLMEDGTGARRIGLFDGNNNAEMATIVLDWAVTAPRYRVRIKRQEIASVAYVLLQVEPSNTWDDPANPNPEPDTSTSKKVLLSSFQVPVGAANEFGFGNAVAGSYTSDWESVHVTVAGDNTTVLPYWPTAPVTPILVFADQGAGALQSAKLSAYSSSRAYLANDIVTPFLDADGTTYSLPGISPPADNLWTFTNLGANQPVLGRVRVADVSGRSRTGSNGAAILPPR